MSIIDILNILDVIGVTASAIAGSILACRRGFDIFGILLISTVASIGGGTIRDLLLNNHPIFWMKQYNYLILIFIASILTMLFYRFIKKLEKPLRFFDAIGLSTYTIIGIEIALKNDMPVFISVIMGIITASFGGIMRDIICNEIPLILKKEIYTTASLIGGIVFFILLHFGIAKEIIYPVTMITIFTVRVVAIYKGLSLPKISF